MKVPLKSMLGESGLGTNAKKCRNEKTNCINCVVRSRGMGMTSADGRKVNVLEMTCFRSLVGVPRMYRVGNA